MPVLSQWEPAFEDDEGSHSEREMPMISRCVGDEDEDLVPKPPYGWWAMVRYDSQNTPVHPLDIACWTLAVLYAQQWSKKAGQRLHLIAREPDGERVLLVDPSLSSKAVETVDDLNNHRTGDSSYCGGWETLWPDLQVKAARVFAIRLANQIPLSALAGVIENEELDPALLLEPPAEWLCKVTAASDLYFLAAAIVPEVYDFHHY